MLRLVSLLSLVAYLLVNTHLNLALGSFALGSPAESHGPAEANESKPAQCKHCAQKAKSENPPPTEDRVPSDGCPCCPTDQGSCPIPGGCAMCSIAKAPCLNAILWIEVLATMSVELVPEYSYSYVTPFSDGLARPPRA